MQDETRISDARELAILTCWLTDWCKWAANRTGYVPLPAVSLFDVDVRESGGGRHGMGMWTISVRRWCVIRSSHRQEEVCSVA